MTSDRSSLALLRAALDLTGTLDLRAALQNFVDRACALTGSPHGALSVLDTWGATTMLIEHHDSPELPTVPGVLISLIPTGEALVVNDPQEIDEVALPPATPPFLGVSVLIEEQVYGRIYLTGKPGGYDPSDVAVLNALAPAAGIAVENAHLYADARRTERWISASQNLTTTMLEGAEEEEALELIARTVREVSRADTAIIVLPSIGDTWAAEITDGFQADSLLGVVFPHEGRAMSVLNEGTGMIVDSMARAQTMRLPALASFGPALYAPLRSGKASAGVLILLRKIGSPEFDSSELSLAESLASQAALALEIASARHAQDVAALFDERDRIGRDLHDFAIQQLFATGMQLDSAKQLIDSGEAVSSAKLSQILDDSLASIDESVRQIRAIIHKIREPDQNVGTVERVRRETSLTRSVLGYAPSLLITLDGVEINAEEDLEPRRIMEFDGRIDPDRSDDIVAVVREGLSNIARHAHATAASVRVELSGREHLGMVRVSIADDGRGIDPDRTRSSGLSNLRERARRHGGTFTLTPGIGGLGTQLTWEIPLASHARESTH
ncbi:GAF domain-containing protein [Schaalia sp. ZJ405]|uniref:sensor histidine kinase n=1 Tax=Schaalia sp. ZJ405 TaxID=2709403 RepID=UPI0013E9EC60|nr:GAF domain-containing protein [Schaalia sp. ZJ405]QPK81900.1 GAF domain-containing protein [Schaalia sp. ZJ405]